MDKGSPPKAGGIFDKVQGTRPFDFAQDRRKGEEKGTRGQEKGTEQPPSLKLRRAREGEGRRT